MNEKQRFGEILVRAGVLDRAALDKVLAELAAKPVDLGEVLVARRLVDEQSMLQAVGKALNLPSVGLDHAQPDERALALVPRALCLRHRLIPIEVERSRTGEHLHVAMANPTDVQAIKAVTREARRRIRPLLAPARAIRAAIDRFYGSEVPSGEYTVDGSTGSAGSASDLFDDELRAALAPESTPLPQVGRPPRRPSAIERAPEAPAQPLIPPDALPRTPPSPPPPPPPRSTTALRRGLDNDLMDALDHSAMGSVAGPDELALAGARNRGGEYGMVRRSRRPRGRGQSETGNLPPPPATPGPLPALPPSLGSRRRRPERTTNRPEPRRRPGTSPPPARMPTSRHAGEVLELDIEPPTPEGVIDDRETSDRLDVRQLLERMVSDPEEGESGSDHVLSEFLDRYGDAPQGSGDRVFAALDRALGNAHGGTARLLVVLIRHLARRGLVDLDELLDALSE